MSREQILWQEMVAELGFPMPVEVRLLAKATPTLGAQVRFLPCVCPLVSDEGDFLAKAVPTLSTDIRLLA